MLLKLSTVCHHKAGRTADPHLPEGCRGGVRRAIVRAGRVFEQARRRREHRRTNRALEAEHGSSQGDNRVRKEHRKVTTKRARRRKQRRTRGGREEAAEALFCLASVERQAVYERASASALPIKKRTTPEMPCGREALTSYTACRIR